MKSFDKFVAFTVTSLAGILAAGSAFAGVVQVIDVPEPGFFGIAAAGVVGVILAARLSRKSK